MIQLTNDDVALQILPELGGKISSLVDRKTGREWLWTHPSLERRPPVFAESFVENLDTGGWDEIFPSISPCELPDSTRIPDHGDLVFLPAEVSDQSSHGLILTTLTRSVRTRFVRKLLLDGRRLEIDYTLESLDPRPIPYLWAAHPLIKLEDGMQLELPTDRLTASDGLELTRTDDGGCRILIQDPAKGVIEPHQLKFFTQRGLAGWASLSATDGSTLRFEWDPEKAPFFGMWLNQRSWYGSGSEPYFNLGFEPTTAPCDCLLEAINAKDHLTLAPGTTASWKVTVLL
ncbi:MAG: hypothetical protein AAGB14_08785 [Verrucomicrobiota bacterium]